MDNCFLINDSYELSHVIIEECMDVPATVLSVTTVFTHEISGNTECTRALVDECNMAAYMTTYPEGTKVINR